MLFICINLVVEGACEGGALVWWLAPEQAVWVRALIRDIALCPWTRHLTLTVPLSTQVYKSVPENLIIRVTLRWKPSKDTYSLKKLLIMLHIFISKYQVPCQRGKFCTPEIVFFQLSPELVVSVKKRMLLVPLLASLMSRISKETQNNFKSCQSLLYAIVSRNKESKRIRREEEITYM